MSAFLVFPSKMIFIHTILKYCFHGLVDVASWKPEETELIFHPPVLHFNFLKPLLKYVHVTGEITPDTGPPSTPRTQHNICRGIHSMQSFIEQMQLETALTFLADI